MKPKKMLRSTTSWHQKLPKITQKFLTRPFHTIATRCNSTMQPDSPPLDQNQNALAQFQLFKEREEIKVALRIKQLEARIQSMKENLASKLEAQRTRLLRTEAIKEEQVIHMLPKQPLSPFLIFKEKNMSLIRDELQQKGELNPILTKSANTKKVNKEIAARFESLSPSEFESYYKQSQQDQIRYETEMKEYNEKNLGFQLTEKEGDLFGGENTNCICIAINQDDSFEHGIAKECKERFPFVKNLYVNHKEYAAQVTDSQGTKIFFLVVKKQRWESVSIDNFKRGFKHLKKMLQYQGVKQLSIPKIGCGGYQMGWDEMKKVMEDTFQGMDLKMTVFTPPQKTADSLQVGDVEEPECSIDSAQQVSVGEQTV